MKHSYHYNAALKYEAVAQAFPERPALKLAGGRTVTHGELNERANRIAALLRRQGLRKRDTIGIVHNKTIECFALMLAALKIGVVYFNIDDQNPPARLEHIFSTARPRAIFADSIPPSVERANNGSAALVEIGEEAFSSLVARETPQAPDESAAITGADPAYIMYTSGSTGVPKGALMSHANVVSFAAWVGSRFDVKPDDTLTNVNPMYFDNSVFDFYGGLFNGAAIAAVTRDVVSDPSAMLRQVEEAQCTLWFSVPSLLIYLMTLKLLEPNRLSAIRSFVFGGEGYPRPELRKLYEAFGARSKLINVYGPTECTCMCSAWDVRPQDLQESSGFVTLGPIAQNFSMLVLDGGGAVSPGGVGELCLLGPQVGLGYVNDAERTARAFVPNPLNSAWSERMYRTGDLVRLGMDGETLDFVGRADNQVKHMGYRIELEEIEAAINQIPGVTQSSVLLREGRRDMKLLVAYLATQRDIEENELRKSLNELLPPYMVPQRFVVRRQLPKNANGKVDRIALANETLV
ncbi:MAG: amino acid adenylation domain-containing protein [Candidatus Aquilonibacter sp.]|jgi:D-alanine--poly(phosphoribitol) ligase subunit 1